MTEERMRQILLEMVEWYIEQSIEHSENLNEMTDEEVKKDFILACTIVFE